MLLRCVHFSKKRECSKRTKLIRVFIQMNTGSLLKVYVVIQVSSLNMFRCRENVDEIVSDSIEELSSDEESTLLCYEEMFESSSSENETN